MSAAPVTNFSLETNLSDSPTPLDHPRFRVFPRDSEKLAIFFSDANTADHSFDWLEAARRIDASAIVVSNGRNQWYQAGIDGLGRDRGEVTGSFRKWAKHLDATSLYAVGSGMGGTGALLHGVPLGARVLAFSCETRMDLVGGDVQRWMEKDFAPNAPDLRPVVEKARAPIFLYAGESDPVGLYSASNVADLPNVFADSFRRVEHDVAAYLDRTKRLAPMLGAFLDDQHLPQVLEGGWGLEEQFSATLYAAHRAATQRRWRDSARFAKRAVNYYPRSDHANYLLGKAMLRLEKFSHAANALTTAVSLNGELASAKLQLAKAMRKLGRPDDAIAVYQQICDHPVVGARVNFVLGQLYSRRGDTTSALMCFRRAVEMDPQRPNFRARLQELDGGEAAA